MVPRIRRSDRPGRRPEARYAPGRSDLHHQTAKAEQDLWQIAVEHLIRAAETGGGWLMLARIGELKALHRGRARVFNSDRKETHWGNAEAEAGRIKTPPGVNGALTSPRPDAPRRKAPSAVPSCEPNHLHLVGRNDPSGDTSTKPRNESAAVGLFPEGPPVALKARPH